MRYFKSGAKGLKPAFKRMFEIEIIIIKRLTTFYEINAIVHGNV